MGALEGRCRSDRRAARWWWPRGCRSGPNLKRRLKRGWARVGPEAARAAFCK